MEKISFCFHTSANSNMHLNILLKNEFTERECFSGFMERKFLAFENSYLNSLFSFFGNSIFSLKI